jgi:hypothetical protein
MEKERKAIITKAGKDVGKMKCLSTAGGNVN